MEERAAFTGGERAKKASDGGEDTSKDSEQRNHEERTHRRRGEDSRKERRVELPRIDTPSPVFESTPLGDVGSEQQRPAV
jgi:hypothetical protein